MLTKFSVAGVVQSFELDDKEHGILRVQTDDNETNVVDIHICDTERELLSLKGKLINVCIATCEGFISTLGRAKAIPLANTSLNNTKLLVYRLVAKSMEFYSVKENDSTNNKNENIKA